MQRFTSEEKTVSKKQKPSKSKLNLKRIYLFYKIIKIRKIKNLLQKIPALSSFN